MPQAKQSLKYVCQSHANTLQCAGKLPLVYDFPSCTWHALNYSKQSKYFFHMHQYNSGLSIHLYMWALSPPLLSGEAWAVKVCRGEGNHATVLASLLAVTQNATSPTVYHQSFRSGNKETERAKGARTGRRLCLCGAVHTVSNVVHVHAHTCARRLQPEPARTASLSAQGSLPSFLFCCGLHRIFKSLLIWCQLYVTHAAHVRIWSYSIKEEYSGTGCSLP